MKKLLLVIFLLSCSALSAQELLPPPAAKYGDNNDETYNTVGLQVQPQFPGGINEFNNYLIKSLKRKITAKGKILVTFVIERDGSLSEVKIIKGGTEKDAERIKKVLLASPKWTPGIQNEKPVRTRFALPLTFN